VIVIGAIVPVHNDSRQTGHSFLRKEQQMKVGNAHPTQHGTARAPTTASAFARHAISSVSRFFVMVLRLTWDSEL
jgi:hypothetical protein